MLDSPIQIDQWIVDDGDPLTLTASYKVGAAPSVLPITETSLLFTQIANNFVITASPKLIAYVGFYTVLVKVTD